MALSADTAAWVARTTSTRHILGWELARMHHTSPHLCAHHPFSLFNKHDEDFFCFYWEISNIISWKAAWQVSLRGEGQSSAEGVQSDVSCSSHTKWHLIGVKYIPKLNGLPERCCLAFGWDRVHFLAVADTGLCFDFSRKLTLVTHWWFSCCWVVFIQVKNFSSSHALPVKTGGAQGVVKWQLLGQLTPGDPKDVPYHVASCSAYEVGGTWLGASSEELTGHQSASEWATDLSVTCFVYLNSFIFFIFFCHIKLSLSQSTSFLTLTLLILFLSCWRGSERVAVWGLVTDQSWCLL